MYNYTVNIELVAFEWDSLKEKKNRQKHGVSFEEARSVFYDLHALLIHDPDHSEEEERFILMGYSAEQRLLVVCHCFRSEDRIIRLISARKATPTERDQYAENYL